MVALSAARPSGEGGKPVMVAPSKNIPLATLQILATLFCKSLFFKLLITWIGPRPMALMAPGQVR